MNRFVPSTLIGLLAAGTVIVGTVHADAATPVVPPDTTVPGAAPADSTIPAPVPATPTTTSLPLFGAQLTIDITSGPGGVLASVAVNPADGFTATEVRPNEVVFVNSAGTATVEVKARNGKQSIEATAVSVDDLIAGTGAGGWSGDVFNTGTITTVGFTVVKAADGSPDITGVTSSDPTAEIGTVEHSDSGARVAIRFVSGSQSRTLSVRVSVGGDDDEDQGGARISVSLGKLRGVAQPADQAAGTRTWNGTLCNGSPASISYTVGADGSISGVVPSPAAESNRLDGNSKADVRFSQNERVRIRVRSNDGQISVSVDEKFRCDSPDPTVNTPVSTTPEDEGDDNNGDNKDRDNKDRDDKDRDNKGGGGNRGDGNGDSNRGGGGDGGHGDD